MLLAGTNNHHSSADQLVEGIEAIVWSISSKLPAAKIIVLVRQMYRHTIFVNCKFTVTLTLLTMLTRNHFTSQPKIQFSKPCLQSTKCGKHRFSDLKLCAIKKSSITDSGDF